MNTLKSLKRMGKLGFLVIIQLAIGISILNIINNLGSSSRAKTITNFFDYENSEFFIIVDPVLDRLKGEEKMSSEDYSKSIEISKRNKFLVENNHKIYSILNKAKEEGLIENVIVYSGMGIGEELFKKLLEKNFIEDKTFNEIRYEEIILINEGFLKEDKLLVKEGRNLNSLDFNKSYMDGNIPILIGGNFKKIYKIGDVIKQSSYLKGSLNDNEEMKEIEFNFEVVGIVEDESVFTTNWLHDKFMESGDLLKSSIIVPITKDISRFSLDSVIFDSSNELYGPILKLNKNVDRKVLEKRLRELLSEINENEINLDFKLSPMASNSELVKFLYNDSTKIIIIGITIIILSIMGLITIILGEMNKRKREFGIKLAVGATRKHIAKELVKEIFTLTFFSITISFWFMYLVIGRINLKPSFLLVNLFLMIILTILISVIPILEIKRLKVIDLIRIQK